MPSEKAVRLYELSHKEKYMVDMPQAKYEMKQSPSGLSNFNPNGSQMDAPEQGIVYVLINESMEGYLKIGVTSGDSPNDVKQRMSALNGTNLPLPFECEYAAVVQDYKRVEKALHTAFGDYRVNPKREFFKDIEPFRVKAVIDLLMKKEVTPEVINAEIEEDSQSDTPKARFTFEMVKIPVGATLHLVGDASKLCTVTGTRGEVEYEGNTYSISGLAKELKQSKWGLQGPRYWIYEDETLQARRERLEEEATLDDE